MTVDCCFGSNPDEACGYPPKTVRAIISITACLISFLVMAFLAVWFAVHERYTEAMGVLGILSTELGTIVGYYFGTKNKSETRAEVIDVERSIARERGLLRPIEMDKIKRMENEKERMENEKERMEKERVGDEKEKTDEGTGSERKTFNNQLSDLEDRIDWS